MLFPQKLHGIKNITGQQNISSGSPYKLWPALSIVPHFLFLFLPLSCTHARTSFLRLHQSGEVELGSTHPPNSEYWVHYSNRYVPRQRRQTQSTVAHQYVESHGSWDGDRGPGGENWRGDRKERWGRKKQSGEVKEGGELSEKAVASWEPEKTRGGRKEMYDRFTPSKWQ